MSTAFRPTRFAARAALHGLRLFAAGAALSAAGQAHAGCAPGAAGPRDFVCTGTIGAFQTLDARTLAMTNAKSTGFMSITPTTGGNVGFSMDSKSSITAGVSPLTSNALTIVTTAGSIDTNTPSGSGINGAITATSGIAIFAMTSGTGSNINLNTGVGGVLSGSAGGILTVVDSNGQINLNLNAKITSTNGVAISATGVDGAINITSNALISGGLGGISAHTTGDGSIAITANAGISATTGPAVQAISDGVGNVTVSLAGPITGVAGVIAQSGGGDVTVSSAGAITGDDGIIAQTSGKGAVTVTTGDLITAANGNGVVTQSVDGWNTVNIGKGGIDASASGVLAIASGEGSIKVTGHGDITGLGSLGIGAATTTGSIEIDLDKGTFVSGGVAGVAVVTTSGEATIKNAGTISGLTTGAGLVADLGGGSLVLTNSGSIEGGAAGAIQIISGAALIKNTGTIDGQVLSAGLTTINNDGIWSNASGSVIQYLNNNGVLSLGPAGGDVGTITIQGDASFSKDSYYNARITTTSNDAILVGGQTTIDGGVVRLSGADASYQRGAKYLLLYSAGGITGQFSSLISDISAFTGILSYDANDVYMTVLARDFRALALNRNQLSVANSIYLGTAKITGGADGQLLTAINNVPDAGIPGVLTQLSGDGVVTGAANAALQASHMFTSVLDDQQTLWRSGGLRDVSGVTLRENVSAYAPVYKDGSKWPVSRQQPQAAPRQPEGRRTWRAWASGFGGQQTMRGDTTTGASPQSMSSYGGAMGVDYQIGSSMLLGVAAGYSSSIFNATATGVQGTTDGFHVGAYTGFRVASFYGSASVTYSGFDNKAKRTVAPFGGAGGEVENSSFSSEEIRTRVEMGRRLSMDAMAITPFAAVEIANLHTKPFVETSTGVGGQAGLFALSYSGQGTHSLPSFVGFKAEARIDVGGGMAFTPWLSLAWRHEWAHNRTQTATLIALPTASFVAIGAQPRPDALQVKAGAMVEITRTAAIFASFEGEFLSKSPVYAGKGGVKIGW